MIKVPFSASAANLHPHWSYTPHPIREGLTHPVQHPLSCGFAKRNPPNFPPPQSIHRRITCCIHLPSHKDRLSMKVLIHHPIMIESLIHEDPMSARPNTQNSPSTYPTQPTTDQPSQPTPQGPSSHQASSTARPTHTFNSPCAMTQIPVQTMP